MAVKIAPARISSLGCAESTAAISRSLRTGSLEPLMGQTCER